VAGRAEDTPPPEHGSGGEPPLRIGVLAIQGDFEAHATALHRLGAEPVQVRRPGQLTSLDGLVIPGGESTTISMGLDAYGLEQPIKDFVAGGGAVFGTCAGLIVLDRAHLGLIDIDARRNAFGRQLHSFEADVAIRGLGDEPVRAVFIRAPWIEMAGEGVDVLAEVEGHPVVARQRNILVAAFHPEMTDDLRLHAYFLALAAEKTSSCPQPERRLAGGRRLFHS
jgi:pyridoxal 5'-phosphate synthase pdxT subunit